MKWVYVALTRATDLSTVRVYADDVNPKTKGELKQYFNNKVDTCMDQDRD